MKKWFKCPWSLLLPHCLFSPSLKLWLLGELFYDQYLIEQRTLGPGIQMVLHQILAPPRNGQLWQYTPFWESIEGQWWRKIPLVGRILNSAPGCSFCFKREMSKLAIMYWFMGLKTNVGWITGLGRNTVEKKWWWENLGRGMWIDFFKWKKKKEDICVSYECSKKMTSAEWVSNKVDRLTCCMDTSQPLSQPPLSPSNGLMNKVAIVVGVEVMYRISTEDFCSTRPFWLWSLLSGLSASSREQCWVPNISPFPEVICQRHGCRLIILDSFHTERDGVWYLT